LKLRLSFVSCVFFAFLFVIIFIAKPLKADDGNIIGFIEAGKELMGQQKYEEALQQFNKAVMTNSKSVQAHFYRGAALYWLKRYGEADKALDKALKLNNEHYLIWYYKGKVANGRNSYKEALGCFEKSIECNHRFKDAWFEKGLILYAMKQHRACIASMGRVINLDKADGRAYCLIGMSYFWLGEMEQANEYIRKGLSIEPTYKDRIPARIKRTLGIK